MSRLCLLGLLVLPLIGSRLAWADNPAPAPARTNVVIILADDLGHGDLGCCGHPRFQTPHLDRMAAQGARMTHFNTPMPFCAPTRASLLTGRYPFRHGLNDNPTPDATPEANLKTLSLEEVTLADVFHQAGYATGMAGKWHLGHKSREFWPIHRGFDEYLGILYSNDMRPVQVIRGDAVVEDPAVQATLTRRYTEHAVAFLHQNRDRPFFYYLAHAMPHKPLACSEAFVSKSGAGLYGDVLAELDWSVGQVLDTLKELGLDERTLVLFTSDNGPWFGGSSGNLRGMKASTFEGGYRVPLIARWPGKISPGLVTDQAGVTPDLFPTALAAAGLVPPANRKIDGQNLLPLLSGQSETPVHDVVFGQTGDHLATVRDRRWKLHVLPGRDPFKALATTYWVDSRAPDGVTILAPPQQYPPTDHPGVQTGEPTPALSLFDLQADPAEQHQVAAKHPEIVARLKAQADRVLDEFPNTRPPNREPISR